MTEFMLVVLGVITIIMVTLIMFLLIDAISFFRLSKALHRWLDRKLGVDK
jgi:uncharacterized membrane protein YbaN (DUF454 family)